MRSSASCCARSGPDDFVSPTGDSVLPLNDGYRLFPVVDASGAWNDCEAQAAMLRISVGTELVTTFVAGCAIQADWKLPTGCVMFHPFREELREYGFMIQSFRNNANQRVVPDLFEIIS